jgi:hypothetical protein
VMYCTNCGAQRPDNGNVCLSCNERIRRFPAAPKIENYLVGSILVTLCCCLPAGVVALIYAAQVNSKLVAGDIAGAQQASNRAKLWMTIGICGGVVVVLLKIVATMMSSK